MSDPNAPKLGAGTILTLITEVGAPLAGELIDLYFRNGEVTAADWQTYRAKARTPFDSLVPQRPGATP